MLRALNTAATGMAAQEQNVNEIANNIANVNTVGFKKGRTEFEDLLYETIREPGSRSSSDTNYNVGIQVGSGAKVTAGRMILTQGSPKITNNPFDLMINGSGYFALQFPNNVVRYTRAGAFNSDAAGNIVNPSGQKLFPNIVLPPDTTSVNISNNGLVEAFLKDQVEPINVGSIPIYTFINPAGLRREGGNAFSETLSSGQAIQNVAGSQNAGSIKQGMLETSNVNVMNEMTDMIKAQRAYEMNSKVMGVADQMLQAVNNVR